MCWLKGKSDLQILKQMIDVKQNSLTILFF